MAQKHGSCLCGSIKYTLTGGPVEKTLCHCTDCQKWTGSAFQAGLFYKKEHFHLTSGQNILKTYSGSVSDNGTTPARSFCGKCGSNIIVTNEANPEVKDMVAIMSGCVDDEAKMGDGPLVEIYCKRAQGWVDVKSNSQKFQELP